MKRAEKDFLKSMDGSSQSDEENQPPKKERRLIKVKKSNGMAGQKMKDEAGQKGQKGQKKGKNKMNDFVLDLGSPPKQPKTQTDGRLCDGQKSSHSPPMDSHHPPIAPSQSDAPPLPMRVLST